MMTKLKYALSFFLGAIYGASILALIYFETNYKTIAAVVFILGSVSIFASVITFFMENWDKE